MRKVLIVDDEECIRDWMVSLFRSHFKSEMEVLTAENGKKALEIINSTSIDLILSDLRMPEMNGIELMAHLTASRIHTPIIFITGYATPSVEKLLYENGAVKILHKPIDAQTLIPHIKESLEWASNQGSMTGISLDNFLQFISWERKSCLVEIDGTPENEGRKGHFYFSCGELWDAVFEKLVGEDAVFAMLCLPNVKISFRELKKVKVKKRITWNLMSLLMEGVRRRDEIRAFGKLLSQKDDGSPELPSEPKDEGDHSAQRETEIPTVEMILESSENKETEGRFEPRSKGRFLSKLKTLQEIDDLISVSLFNRSEAVDFMGMEKHPHAELGKNMYDILMDWRNKESRHGLGSADLIHFQTPVSHIVVKRISGGCNDSLLSPNEMYYFIILVIGLEGNLVSAKRRLDSAVQELIPALK